MDGNGRWANQRHLPRIAGHRAGAKAVRAAITFCVENHIAVLTLFALSVENTHNRPKSEVDFLLSLFAQSLEEDVPDLHARNVRMRIIGDHQDFNEALKQKIKWSEHLTAKNTGLTVVIAVNYSGRWDITQATNKLLEQMKNGTLNTSNITEQVFSQYLCLQDLPEPDLLIRTSGEQRISNFMLWQFAYTELFFSSVYWPDFDERIFSEALEFYRSRERRFGRASKTVECS